VAFVEDVEMDRACSKNGRVDKPIGLLVGKLEGKKPLQILKRRLVDNIKTDLGEIEWSGMDWSGLSQDSDKWGALANAVKIQRTVERLHSW
jgi:hypothetical protein